MNAKSVSPILDPEQVRRHLRSHLPKIWGARVSTRMGALGLRNAHVAARAGTTRQTLIKVRQGDHAATPPSFHDRGGTCHVPRRRRFRDCRVGDRLAAHLGTDRSDLVPA